MYWYWLCFDRNRVLRLQKSVLWIRNTGTDPDPRMTYGSVPLTYESGSFSFRWLSRCQQKIRFAYSLQIAFWRFICTSVFEVVKKSQNSTCFCLWCVEIMTDPDPGDKNLRFFMEHWKKWNHFCTKMFWNPPCCVFMLSNFILLVSCGSKVIFTLQVDESTGRMTGAFKTYAICGAIRSAIHSFIHRNG